MKKPLCTLLALLPLCVFSISMKNKTVALQPGDLVPVAYRMNATDAPDEVAFLALTDIPAGTKLHVTDAKYTNNSPAQCPGGLVWTATAALPAGTVFSIQPDASVASAGALSGEGFGLSSQGDQVIVYSGEGQYITAVSSNAWVGSQTACDGNQSRLPSGLQNGASAISLASASGNTAGNTVNAFFSGSQGGGPSAWKAAVLNPANWTGAGAGTPPQTWPAFRFN